MFESNSILHTLVSILFFPVFFQGILLNFALASSDDLWLQLIKWFFLLLPILIFIGACWITIIALISIIFRHRRNQFTVALVLSWWDLGRAIVAFWGGIFRFIFSLIYTLVGLVKIIILWLWSTIRDIVLLPFRLLANLGRGVASSSVPWVAVVLTLFWCIIEATIFTYVTTPLVIDVFSNITGTTLSINAVRIPLYIFLFFIVLGSYAVLSTFLDTAKKKKISSTIGIGMIEVVVLLVEVLFLYRELVDSLVPWFAQYSENFELGIVWTIVIAAFVWFGIRSLSWFLFAEYGTPTLLAIIQGKGVALEAPKDRERERLLLMQSNDTFFRTLRADADWIRDKGEELINNLMLPPLQLIAAMVNFIILLLTASVLFELPFQNIKEIFPTGRLTRQLYRETSSSKKAEASQGGNEERRTEE